MGLSSLLFYSLEPLYKLSRNSWAVAVDVIRVSEERTSSHINIIPPHKVGEGILSFCTD